MVSSRSPCTLFSDPSSIEICASLAKCLTLISMLRILHEELGEY